MSITIDPLKIQSAENQQKLEKNTEFFDIAIESLKTQLDKSQQELEKRIIEMLTIFATLKA